MALTLLVEYGLLGSLHARLRRGLQRCMGARRHARRRQQGYAPLDEEAPLQEGEQTEDEDVEAERSALQAGEARISSACKGSQGYMLLAEEKAPGNWELGTVQIGGVNMSNSCHVGWDLYRS